MPGGPRSRDSPHGTRHTAKPVRKLHRAITVIPAEEFVSAVAAERDLDVLARLTREVMRRDRRAVGEGFTEDRSELGQVLDHVRRDAELVMVRPEVLRDLTRVAALVVARVVEGD